MSIKLKNHGNPFKTVWHWFDYAKSLTVAVMAHHA